MNKLSKGILAGFVATVVLSLLMVIKTAMGLLPDVDIIGMLSKKMGGSMVMGWTVHFMIGTLGYGLMYAYVFSSLPFGDHVKRGIVLGLAGWMVMTVAVMPMMGAVIPMIGASLFGISLVPIVTMVLYAIFGAVLGFTYSKL